MYQLTETSSRPAPARAGQPPGTRSVMFSITNRGEQVAMAHAYVLPDGTLGGSGLLDPKTIRVQDTLHFI